MIKLSTLNVLIVYVHVSIPLICPMSCYVTSLYNKVWKLKRNTRALYMGQRASARINCTTQKLQRKTHCLTKRVGCPLSSGCRNSSLTPYNAVASCCWSYIAQCSDELLKIQWLLVTCNLAIPFVSYFNNNLNFTEPVSSIFCNSFLLCFVVLFLKPTYMQHICSVPIITSIIVCSTLVVPVLQFCQGIVSFGWFKFFSVKFIKHVQGLDI